MLSKKNTQELYTTGSKISTLSFNVIWNINTNENPDSNIVISVPKKNIKKAVDRNYIKRIIREIYMQNRSLVLKPINCILIYTKSSLPEFNKLKEELVTLLQNLIVK